MQDPKLRKRWMQKFVYLNADGVDFVSNPELTPNGEPAGEIYASYTKKELLALPDYDYPRSHYIMWKMLFGAKCYIKEKSVFRRVI